MKYLKSLAVVIGLVSVVANDALAQSIIERQEAMFRRNVGTPEQQRAQFPPHKIAGNLYYVGSESLASFLVTTPAGHILVNTNWEDGVPNIQKSVEDLGFDFGDIEIILGSHAHADHMQGDALVKELTGADVVVMAEDVPLLERMTPGGKPHPIDRVLTDGETVTLGGTTLVARLTPGHTPGCTTWTLTVEENGETYDVVIVGSMGSNPGFQFVNNPNNPTIADQYKQGFAVLRSLSPDIPLASHPAMYNMVAKHARLGGPTNPYVDPEGYWEEIDAVEDLFLDVLAEQQAEARNNATGFLQSGLYALDRNLGRLIDDGRLAGIVTMLARDGRIAHAESYGYSDVAAGIPMTMDTIVRIASMTKPVTGVAMMMLYEQGLWTLDDPVAKFIPEFENLTVADEDENGEIRRVPQDHPMTMRELMTHTGGLTYGAFSESAVDVLYREANITDRNSSLEEMIDKLAAIPLRQQPGSLWHYSVSVDVQGYIVERLSGQSLPEFFAEHIFEPLGMVDTGFHVPADKLDRLASVVYESGPNGGLVPSNRRGDLSRPPGLPSGGGGLVSTAGDYMRFAQMLLNGGELDGVRILKPETVELMRMNHAPTTRAEGLVQLGPGMGFGMDVAVILNPAAANVPLGAGSYYWAGAAGTWFWIDPANELIFIAMAQHNYFSITDIVAMTRNWVYQALADPPR